MKSIIMERREGAMGMCDRKRYDIAYQNLDVIDKAQHVSQTIQITR